MHFPPFDGSGNESEFTKLFDEYKVDYDLGYKVIMWSKDTIDWRDSDENLLIKRKLGDMFYFSRNY